MQTIYVNDDIRNVFYTKKLNLITIIHYTSCENKHENIWHANTWLYKWTVF